MEGRWERGQGVIHESLEFAKAGQKEQALNVLDNALAEAIQENRATWVSILCSHAAVLAHAMGDRRREIH
jgi:hypothetical protein